MKHSEAVQDYMSRITSVVNEMRAFTDTTTDQTVVAKVLRSLTSRFDHIFVAIEESKDLTQFSIDELSGSLHAHEARMNHSAEKTEEKAFQVKAEASTTKDSDKFIGRGRDVEQRQLHLLKKLQREYTIP